MSTAFESIEMDYVVELKPEPKRNAGRMTQLALAVIIAAQLALAGIAARHVGQDNELAAVAPPRPGVYHRQSVTSSWSKYTTVTTKRTKTTDITERLDWLSSGEHGTRVRTTHDNGASVQLWKPDGVYQLESPKFHLPFEMSCTEQDDHPTLPLPLRVGRTWERDARCDVVLPEFGRVTLRHHSVSRVTRTRSAKLGRRDVAVFEISTASSGGTDPPSGSAASPIQMSLSETSTALFAPRLGVFVRNTSVSRTSGTATFAGRTSKMESGLDTTSRLVSGPQIS